MTTHTPSHSTLADLDPTERLEDTLTNVNERIARLAMGLNADIDSPQDIMRILSRDVPALRPHLLHQQADAHGLVCSPEHRLHNAWEELRGLLALRCDIVTEALKNKGITATTAIATDVQDRLTRDGFKPGADGFHLLEKISSQKERC